jgi:hypothetical protein
MITMHALLLLAVLQLAPGGEPLRTGCSSDDRQIASVVPGDRVEVQSALAGEGPTCYKINVIRSGQNLAGYIVGESLPAIQDFVDRRERISEAAATEEARRARLAALAPKPALEKVAGAADPLISTRFEDFKGKDSLGKPVSLSGLKGRVTLVTFWSPRALSPLMQEMPLYLQLHKEGLAAVGVCTNPYADLSETLDDVTLPWPQINDPGGLTARYHVDPRAGKTFVLDENQRIVAAGPMGPDIDKAVRKLMGAPEDQ